MDRRLAGVARQLSDLVRLLPPEHMGDLLDLISGALASLIRASQLKYENRIDEELPPSYYVKLSERVRRMAEGTLPPHGRWLAGYYFNSALLRLGAAREITRGLFTALDKKKATVGPSIAKAEVDSVYEEYGKLKHALRALRLGRHVTFDQSIQSLDELICALRERRKELSDPKTKFPLWPKRR